MTRQHDKTAIIGRGGVPAGGGCLTTGLAEPVITCP